MTKIDENAALLERLILKAASECLLKKAVFSKSLSPDVKKAMLTVKEISGGVCLQIESFMSDNKAKHRNIPIDDTDSVKEMISQFCQINLYTSAGECEYKVSKSSNSVLIGGTKLERAILYTKQKPTIKIIKSLNMFLINLHFKCIIMQKN